MEYSLDGEGYELVFADSGNEALKKARADAPDIILLDVMMPDIDGFETCRLIREDPLLAEVPIIMITSLDDQESLLRGIKSGADDFISKPIARSELQARVRTITRLNRYRKLLIANQQLEEEIERFSTLYNISSKLNLHTDINEVVQDITENIKECLNAESITIHFGRQSIEGVSKIAELVFDKGETIRISDTSKDDGFSSGNSEYVLGVSCLCVPLHGKKDILGVIKAIKRRNDEFAEDDQQMMEAIANNVAIAYERTLLHQELIKMEALLRRQNAELKMSVKQKYRFESIIGNNEGLLNVLKKAEQIAPSDSNVMIYGETGTGKELLANAIHQSSPRVNNRFITINCSAIPENLLESELFGHEKGSYTGANTRRIGRFEDANNGTLFLDEIGDMPLGIQARLLRVLQDGVIQRLGSNTDIYVDVRIITATHHDLHKLVAEGDFRRDLYYRLRVFELVLPSLRERKEDIPLLINYFIKHYNKKLGKKISGIDGNVVDILSNHDYPGNIRELQYIMESAITLCKREIITIDDIQETTIASIVNKDELSETLGHELPTNNEELKTAKAKARQDAEARVELSFLKKVLSETQGNVSEAARKANMNRSWLAQLVSKHKLDLGQP